MLLGLDCDENPAGDCTLLGGGAIVGNEDSVVAPALQGLLPNPPDAADGGLYAIFAIPMALRGAKFAPWNDEDDRLGLEEAVYSVG